MRNSSRYLCHLHGGDERVSQHHPRCQSRHHSKRGGLRGSGRTLRHLFPRLEHLRQRHGVFKTTSMRVAWMFRDATRFAMQNTPRHWPHTPLAPAGGMETAPSPGNTDRQRRRNPKGIVGLRTSASRRPDLRILLRLPCTDLYHVSGHLSNFCHIFPARRPRNAVTIARASGHHLAL